MNLDRFNDENPPRREVLPGGAVLLSRPIPSVHSVALGVWLRWGAQDEPAGLEGLTHFLEHIVFKGTASRSAFEIARAFDSLGVAVDAFTTKDQVAFTIKVLPEYLDPACAILADMLLRPAFDPELVTLEQDVVCEEIQEAFDTPEDRLHDAFAARIFGAHPRGRPILGNHDSVRRLEPEVLRREHGHLFAGENVVIAVAGNLQDGSLATVREHFQFPGPAAAPPPPPTESGDTGRADSPAAMDRRLELKSPIVQSYFEIGNLGIPILHEDRVPLILLANILGGGLSSRIFQAVREREGLAYTVYNYSDLGREIGLVSCAGCCSPEKAARVEEVIRSEYGRLIADGVGADELANNCAQIKSQLIFSLEGVPNQMFRLAKNEVVFGRFLPVAELVTQIDAVDPDVIARCASAYFDPDRLVVATHGPL